MVTRLTLGVVLLAAASFAPALAGPGSSSTGTVPATVTQPPTAVLKKAPDPLPPVKVPQLTPMYLDKKIFTPDHWWEYEEAEDELSSDFSVEQHGMAKFGSRTMLGRGAAVAYKVLTCPSDQAAHQAFVHFSQQGPPTPNVRRTARSLHHGDESLDRIYIQVEPSGKPHEIRRESYLRFGRYVILLSSWSDIRAFGPRPSRGERPWMSEPVYQQVYQEVLSRWTHYRTLLASAK